MKSNDKIKFGLIKCKIKFGLIKCHCFYINAQKTIGKKPEQKFKNEFHG